MNYMKSSSFKFTGITKTETSQDITYTLTGNNNKTCVILSVVKYGYIDSESQKYLKGILNKN